MVAGALSRLGFDVVEKHDSVGKCGARYGISTPGHDRGRREAWPAP